jgi:LuxR family maltose regulon positive regulatory protein
VAWAWLDADDNQPERFWFTLVMALQTIHPGLGQGLLPQLHALSPAAISAVSVHLTNEIIQVTEASDFRQPMALILDDYHLIEQPDIHSSVETCR